MIPKKSRYFSDIFKSLVQAFVDLKKKKNEMSMLVQYEILTINLNTFIKMDLIATMLLGEYVQCSELSARIGSASSTSPSLVRVSNPLS